MPLIFNTKTYTPDSFGNTAVGYIGAGHTASTKDDLVLRRQAAKPTSAFSGVSRTQSKLTRTVNLTGSLTPKSEMLVAIDVTVPVGTADADVDAIVADMAAYVSSADFLTHVKTQKTNF
jgi:hypothetical protein